MITEQYSLNSHELIDDMKLLTRSKQIYGNKKKISLTENLSIRIESLSSSFTPSSISSASSTTASASSSRRESQLDDASLSDVSFKESSRKNSFEALSPNKITKRRSKSYNKCKHKIKTLNIKY